MHEKFKIIVNIQKTIEYLEDMTENFPKIEYVLKNKIIDSSYTILEQVHRANIYKETKYKYETIVNIRMLNYYIKKAYDKNIISKKQYEKTGQHLLEILLMINGWIKNEQKSK